MANWVLAIDFGTTSTAAAIRVDGRVERIEIDGAPRMPSMVFWHEGTGSSRTGRLVVGEEAEELSGLAPWCLERTPKRRIGDEFILLGDHELRVVDVIGAILRKVAEEALSVRGGERPSEVRLTHPARWGRLRLEKLGEAAEIAGLGDVVFIAEPVAAATHFASERLSPGQYVAVYDLGGGTFDTALLRRTEDSFELAGAPGGNENLGGEDFDDRLYRYLGRQLSQDHWHSLRESNERVWSQANRELLRSARRAKEFLSRSPRYEFYMSPPIDQELVVSRESFRELIVDDIEDTVAELERTVRAAEVDPSQVAAIYLAGGSSRIPLVARVIQQHLGQVPETWDDPKAVTVLGAARPSSAPATASTLIVPEHPTRQLPPATQPMSRRRTPTPPPVPRRTQAPAPERQGAGHRAALIVGLAVIALAGIAVGALAAAGTFSGSSTTSAVSSRQTTTVVVRTVRRRRPTTTPAPSRPSPPSPGLTPCPENPHVFVLLPYTSCGFAIRISKGYVSQAQQNGGPGSFQVTERSPVSGETYTDACEYDASSQLVTCSHGNGEEVQFSYPPTALGSGRSPSIASPQSATTTGQFASFVGTWGAHEESLVISNSGTGHLSYADLTACPSCSFGTAPTGTVEFVLSSVTQGDGTGTITASSDQSNYAVGAPVTVSLKAASPGQFLEIVIGGNQLVNFCNSTSQGQCGA